MIQRYIYSEIFQHLTAKEITLITGARQVGKTTLMRALEKNLRNEGRRTLYFNLDYQTDFDYFRTHDTFLGKLNLELGEEPGVIFIDEIQRLKNAGLFLKGLYDLPLPHKMVVTGSGSVELKEQVKESLSGRKRVLHMLPVSFAEFADYHSDYKYSGRIPDFLCTEKGTYNRLLEDYLAYGGFPRVVTEQNVTEKRKLIDEIFSSYAVKDLAFLTGARDPDAIILLSKLLAARTAQLLKTSEVAHFCGLSSQLANKYLGFMEGTYFINRVKPFFGNVNKELTKSSTLYFVDLGIRNFLLGAYSRPLHPADTGFVFQNAVYLALSGLLRWSGFDIKYWRTADGAEVDFVVDKGRCILPIEVKYSDLTLPKVPGALKSFIRTYKPETCIIINKSLEATVSFESSSVHFLPFYRLFDKDRMKYFFD